MNTNKCNKNFGLWLKGTFKYHVSYINVRAANQVTGQGC